MNSTPNEDDSVDDVNTDELSYYCLNALKRAISVQRMTYFLCFLLSRLWGAFSML